VYVCERVCVCARDRECVCDKVPLRACEKALHSCISAPASMRVVCVLVCVYVYVKV